MLVKIKNPLWPYRKAYAFPVQEFLMYDGELVDSPSWAKDKLCLSTNDSRFNIRVLDKEDVIGNGFVKKKPKTVKTWQIEGSKNNTYTVTNDLGKWSCTCVGFSFRRSCKHIMELRK